MARPTIVAIEVESLTMPGGVTSLAEGSGQHWQNATVATPLSRYSDQRHTRLGPAPIEGLVVSVTSSTGAVGIAPIKGGPAAGQRILQQLRPQVIGAEVAHHRRIWDRMVRTVVADGVKGSAIYPCAAIDLAVWDLHGRMLEVPVYDLIGGGRPEAVRAYATGPHAEVARRHGFAGAKLPLAHAPAAGAQGWADNLARLAAARAAVGPDFGLMLDSWMSLTVDYAVRLMDAMADLGYDWLEEPVMSDDYWAMAEIRRRGSDRVRLAAGEHEYGIRGMRMLIEQGHVDVIQPDLFWSGLTENIDVAAFASAHGVPVIPHGSTPYAIHLVASRPELDLVEFYMADPSGTELVPLFPYLQGETMPVEGMLQVADRAGFGLEIHPRATRESLSVAVSR